MGDFYNSLKSNLENFSNALAETADVVVQKTEDGIEVQKIKSQIRVLERNNARDYQEIGKIIYDRFEKGELDDETIEKICENIKEREDSIEKQIKQMESVKGVSICRGCQEPVAVNAVYCPKCGAKVKGE